MHGTSLVVQWLRLCAPNAGDPGSIPGWGTGSHMPQLRVHMPDFPGGTVVKNPPANAGDMGSIPSPGIDPTCQRATKPMHHNY